MISKPKAKKRLSKVTIMRLKTIAKKGTDAEIEEFFYRVAMAYIADVRGTDYIDEEDYINVKDYTYQCECPYCGQMLELELKQNE